MWGEPPGADESVALPLPACPAELLLFAPPLPPEGAEAELVLECHVWRAGR